MGMGCFGLESGKRAAWGSLQAATTRRLLRFAARTGWRKRAVAKQDTSLKGGSDADDDPVLAAGADLIASGDRRDLLPLGSYEGIPIVTALEALQRLGL